MFFFFLFRSPSLATRECIRGRIHGPSVFKSVIDARIHAIAVRSWQPDNYSCLTRHHDQSVFPTPRAHACKFVHLTTTDFFIKSGATDRRDFSVFRFDSTGHGKHTVAGFPNRCLPFLPVFATPTSVCHIAILFSLFFFHPPSSSRCSFRGLILIDFERPIDDRF